MGYCIFDEKFTFYSTDAREDYEYFKTVLRCRVFLDGVTHVDTIFNYRLFQNKGTRPNKDAFELFFVAAGTPTLSTQTVIFKQ